MVEHPGISVGGCQCSRCLEMCFCTNHALFTGNCFIDGKPAASHDCCYVSGYVCKQHLDDWAPGAAVDRAWGKLGQLMDSEIRLFGVWIPSRLADYVFALEEDLREAQEEISEHRQALARCGRAE